MATSSWGQGFFVKPMVMQISAKPGTTVTKDIEATSTSQDVKVLNLYVGRLGQSSDGSYVELVPPEQTDSAPGGPRSCRSWFDNTTGKLSLAPGQPAHYPVTLKVPGEARGSYCAGVFLQSEAPPLTRGQIGIVIRFLIEVFVDVDGTPARSAVGVEDQGMARQPKNAKRPYGAVAWLKVANTGEATESVGGSVSVSASAGDAWRVVTTTPLRTRKCLPGSHLRLDADLQRNLPSGKYLLQYQFEVGGRVVAHPQQIVDYEGDPAIGEVPVDVAIRVDTPVITVNATPGSTRSVAMTIENPSDAPLVVHALSAAPQELVKAFVGDRRGRDSCCAAWVTVSPETTTLAPHSKRNLRVVVAYPAEAPDVPRRPRYFALVDLDTQYADGRGAGHTTANVLVNDSALTAKTEATGAGIRLAQQAGGQYVLTADFLNTGDTGVTATTVVAAVQVAGQPTVATCKLTGDGAELLPLCKGVFSGPIDLSKAPDGVYTLSATMTADVGKWTQTAGLKIGTKAGQRSVELFQASEAPK
jgi:hypothetical protein